MAVAAFDYLLVGDLCPDVDSTSMQEKFVLEKKKKGCVVLEDDFVMHTSGRMSFMNYNPEVDALNAEHQERIKQIEVENAERNDVSEKEMAEVLGKRKHLSDSGDASGGQHPTDSKTEDRIPSVRSSNLCLLVVPLLLLITLVPRSTRICHNADRRTPLVQHFTLLSSM